MESKGVEKYSPRWLGDCLHRGQDRIFNRVLKFFETTRWIHLVNLVILISFLSASWYIFRYQTVFSLLPGEARNLVISRYTESLPMILILCALGTAGFYLSAATLPVFGILGFIIGVCSLYFFDDGRYYHASLSLTLNLILSFSFFLLFYWLRSRLKTQILKWDFLLGAYVAMAVSYLIDYKFGINIVWYFEITRLLFVFSLLSLEYGARRNASRQDEFAYIFSAMNLLTPVPVEARDRHYTSDWNVRLRGLADILISLVFLATALEVKRDLLRFPLDPEVGNVFLYGLINYFYYFLGSFAWIGLPIGIGRWFGMRLPDYFDLPLLAVSPADRWRRWNTYYYNWFYKVLFFPFYKKTRSLAIAIIAVTAATLIVHSGSLNYGLFLGETDLLKTRTFILVSLFFSLHGLLIYLSIKFPRFWPSENNRRGWWGVALMTALMALVHIIAPK